MTPVARPRGHIGSLSASSRPAASRMSRARCRAALEDARRRDAHADAGLSGGDAAASGVPKKSGAGRIISAGRPAARRLARRSRSVRARRAASVRRGPETLTSRARAPTGRTTACALPRCRASPPISVSASCPPSCLTSCTRMTGRRGLAPAYLHYHSGAAARHGDDHSQHGLSGQVRPRADRRHRPALELATTFAASNISAASVF